MWFPDNSTERNLDAFLIPDHSETATDNSLFLGNSGTAGNDLPADDIDPLQSSTSLQPESFADFG